MLFLALLINLVILVISSPNSNSFNSKHDSNKNMNACYGCGGNHWRNKCPFKNANCFKCNGKGHIQSKCRSGKNNSSATKRQQNLIKEDTPTNASGKSCETSLDSYTSFLFHTKDSAFSSDPYIIKTHLDKVKFDMELDTGAARSVLSSVDFYKLWPAKVDRATIDNSSSTLKAYGGFKLPVLGEIKVLVKTERSQKSAIAPIVVIEGDGPGLFGRDLIQLLEVNLGEGICLNSITNFKTEMERKFPTLFSPGLGCYSGVKFSSLTVDPAIPPKLLQKQTSSIYSQT